MTNDFRIYPVRVNFTLLIRSSQHGKGDVMMTKIIFWKILNIKNKRIDLRSLESKLAKKRRML